MTYAELIYKLAVLFFTNFWYYIAFMLFVMALQGRNVKLFSGIGRFFSNVKAKYKASVEKKKRFEEFEIPSILKGQKEEGDTVGKSQDQ